MDKPAPAGTASRYEAPCGGARDFWRSHDAARHRFGRDGAALRSRPSGASAPSRRSDAAGRSSVGCEPTASMRGGARFRTDGTSSKALGGGRGVPCAAACAFAQSSWTTRPSMPPATVTTWPVTWPESSSEASTTTWRATSSGCATLRSAIVRETRAHPLGVDVAARHRRLRPARRDAVDAAARRDADDLVLEARAAGRRRSPTSRPRSRRGPPRRRGRRSSRRGRASRGRSAPPRAGSARAVRKVAVRFARSVSSQRSSGSSQTGTSSRGQTPATAAQTSTLPSSRAPSRRAGRPRPRASGRRRRPARRRARRRRASARSRPRW